MEGDYEADIRYKLLISLLKWESFDKTCELFKTGDREQKISQRHKIVHIFTNERNK